MPTIAFLHSLVRAEEKLLISELRKVGFDLFRWDTRKQTLNLNADPPEFDIAFERSVSTSQGLHTISYFETFGIPTVNTSEVIRASSDKIMTSMLFRKFSVPQPEIHIAHSTGAALEAIEEIGYPVVLKPAVGSWGRLLAKINDRDAAEAILEHKSTLGNYIHSSFYIQNLVEKGGRDIRSFVIGEEVIAAIYRSSEHWITNTSRGGNASNCLVTAEIEELSLKAVRAVNRTQSPSLLAVDLFETKDGIVVNEINSTMEFRNSIETTGVNIPQYIAEYLQEVVRR